MTDPTDPIESSTTIHHSDGAANDLNNTDNDGSYSVDLTYQHNPDKDDTELGPIEERGTDGTLKHPVKDTNELYHRAHITSQFAESNRPSESVGSLYLPELSDDQVVAFDTAIQDLVPWALNTKGTSLADLPIAPRHTRTLLLHDAWEMASLPGIAQHLDEWEHLRDRIGYDSTPDQSTIWGAAETLNDNQRRKVIVDAATHAVHAVFRNGTVIRTDVGNAHGLDFGPTIDERDVRGPTKRAAIINWFDQTLDDVLTPLSFGRAANASISVKQIVGTIAQAGYAASIDSAPQTGGWYHDPSEFPTANHVRTLISSLDQSEILRMAAAMHRRFGEMVSQLGFLNGNITVAADLTWVTWSGKGDGDDDELALINNPEECETGTGWAFASLGSMDSDERFAFGIDLIDDKSEKVDHLRHLLRTVGELGDIGGIYADRGFERGDAVKMCRDAGISEWGLRVRDNNRDEGEVADVISEVEEDESLFRKNVEYAGVSPPPNVYIHPIPEEQRSGNTHMTFLTDLPEEKARRIFYKYQNRWNIETFFNQLKNQFCPDTASPSPELRLFLFNMALLFYNYHTLINRAPSQTYQLRLDVPYYDVLLGLVNSVFSLKGPTEV